MKSYVLALLLIVILFVAGCGAQKSQTAQQTSSEQTQQTAETPVLDETTDVDAVEENLSPADSTEDDYGDII